MSSLSDAVHGLTRCLVGRNAGSLRRGESHGSGTLPGSQGFRQRQSEFPLCPYVHHESQQEFTTETRSRVAGGGPHGILDGEGQRGLTQGAKQRGVFFLRAFA